MSFAGCVDTKLQHHPNLQDLDLGSLRPDLPPGFRVPHSKGPQTCLSQGPRWVGLLRPQLGVFTLLRRSLQTQTFVGVLSPISLRKP